MSNFSTLKVSASAALLALTIGFTLPAIAQDADTPPSTEETTPPDSDSAAPSDEATPPDATAPDDNGDAAPNDEAPSDETPGDDNGGSDASGGGAEPMHAPAASHDAGEQSAAAEGITLKASDLTLNAPVIGSDGKEIGTVSRISSTAEGTVAKIYVKVGDGSVVIPGSAITEGGSNVKLSLSSDDVGKLQASGGDDNSNG